MWGYLADCDVTLKDNSCNIRPISIENIYILENMCKGLCKQMPLNLQLGAI